MKHSLPDISGIPGSKYWRKVEFLDKGWSTDKKYCIETDEKRLILRIADISQYEKKKTEYERMGLIYRLGLNMSQPVAFGSCDGGSLVYILLTWLEGTSAEDTLPKVSISKQSDWGASAGRMLKIIHSVSAPDGQQDWSTRMIRKIKMKISQYQDCGHVVPNAETVMRFINANLQHLENRPQTLQHGDFHPGNMVITPENKVGLIDFNRMDFGDPWEEFVRATTFTKSISTPFAIGQINAYFDRQPPESFFRVLSLYSAIDALFGIIWAIPFGQDEIDESLARSKSIFDDYCGFETYIPVWYK